jgi:transcription factor E
MQNKRISRSTKSKSKVKHAAAPKKAARAAKATAKKSMVKMAKTAKVAAKKRFSPPKIAHVKKIGARALAKELALRKLKAAEAEQLERKRIEKEKINEIIERASFSEFMSQNIGKRAVEIIKVIRNPQTDEEIAAELGMKINEARRILNVLSSYGVARYDANKDSKGWLTFEWYLDSEKLSELDNTIATRKPESTYALPEDCNDFFYCTKCYDDQKIVLPFDAAFENQFKCDACGNKLKQLNREEATSLFEKEGTSDQPE